MEHQAIHRRAWDLEQHLRRHRRKLAKHFEATAQQAEALRMHATGAMAAVAEHRFRHLIMVSCSSAVTSASSSYSVLTSSEYGTALMGKVFIRR